jgi:glucokinase
MDAERRYVALDIGGTKLLVASADETGSILRRVTRPTPVPLTEGLDALHEMIAEVLDGALPTAIGAAVGGPLDYQTGIVSPLHQPEWREVPLKEIMQERWRCPFMVDVDTNVAALGEYRFGGERKSPLLYMTISTGVGGGLLIDGQIYRGANGAHPEVGHIFVRSGAKCSCGQDGCLEAWISGYAIQRNLGAKPQDLPNGQWDYLSSYLSVAIRNLTAVLAPAVIVLGGGIGLELAKSIRAVEPGLVPMPEVRASRLGYDTALMGAVSIAMQGL